MNVQKNCNYDYCTIGAVFILSLILRPIIKVESIKENKSINQLALKKKDILMQLGIKLFYDLLLHEEIEALFPKLSEEYNNDYIIRVNDTLAYLLLASGYKIAHRPAI